MLEASDKVSNCVIKEKIGLGIWKKRFRDKSRFFNVGRPAKHLG